MLSTKMKNLAWKSIFPTHYIVTFCRFPLNKYHDENKSQFFKQYSCLTHAKHCENVKSSLTFPPPLLLYYQTT